MSQYLGQDRHGRHNRGPGIQLTGRGAIVAMAAFFVLGVFLSVWLDASVITGAAYLAGSLVAARYTKPTHLLMAAVSPPLVFMCALLAVKLTTASGNTAVSTGGGVLLALAGAAPWLFAGTAAALALAWYRGLPRCVADLRREIRSDVWQPGADTAPHTTPAPRRR